MSRFITLLLIAGFAFAVNPAPASATYCRAQSATGQWGWGSSMNFYRARYTALVNCSARTPRGWSCFVRCY